LKTRKDPTGANRENGEERAAQARTEVAAPGDWRVPPQKLYRFFTGFHVGHKKKSVRKCNKVKFNGFSAGCDITFLYHPDEVHDQIFHR